MKKILLLMIDITILTITLALSSCKKNDVTNPTIADKLSGNFVVTEHAETVVYSQRYPTVDTVFHSKITRINDSTISFMDTINTPKRVYRYSFSREIKPTDRELWAVGYKQGNYSLNNDTLKITYLYGVDASTAYIVNQKWVRE